MECSSCRVPLKMTERQGVEIDYCPTCRGVWLDEGELDKILQRSHELSGSGRGRSDAGHGRREYGHPKRKKSKKMELVEELFDLFG